MAQTAQVKTEIETITVPTKALKVIFEQLHLLRNEVMFLFPQEDLEDYAHPERIRDSYREAIKNYPPVSLWK